MQKLQWMLLSTELVLAVHNTFSIYYFLVHSTYMYKVLKNYINSLIAI